MKTENRISAAFDAASPDELEALLEGVDTENVDRITAKPRIAGSRCVDDDGLLHLHTHCP